MATEDVILQIKADVADVLSKLDQLTDAFAGKVREMDQAAKGVDFDPATESAQQLVRELEDVGEEALASIGAAVSEVGRLRDAGGETSEEFAEVAQSIEKVVSAVRDGAEGLGRFAAHNAQVGRLALAAERLAGALDPDVNAALERAEQSLVELSAAVDRGSGGFDRYAAVAKVRFEEVEQAIEDAEQAGRTLGEAPRAALGEMRAELDSSIRSAVRYSDALEDVREESKSIALETGAATSQFRSLDDLMKGLSPRLFNAFVQLQILQEAIGLIQNVGRRAGDGVTFMAEAFGRSADEARDLGDAVSDVLAGDLFQLVSGVIRLKDILTEADKEILFVDTLAKVNTELSEAKERFDALGVSSEGAIAEAVTQVLKYEQAVSTAADGTRNLGQVTEDQARLIVASMGEVVESIQLLPAEQRKAFAFLKGLLEAMSNEYRGVVQDLSESGAQLADEIRGTEEELKQQTETLIEAYQKLRAEGGLTDDVIVEISRRVDEQSDAWERFGATAPEELAKVGIHLEALVERINETRFATLQLEAAEELFLKQVRGSREEIAIRTQAIVSGTRALEESGEVTTEVADKIAQAIASLIERYREFGIEVPSALQGLADEYLPLIEQTEKLAEATGQAEEELDGLLDTAASARDRLKPAQDALKQYQKTVDELGNKPILTEEEAQALSEAERELFFAKDATEELTDATESLGEATADNQTLFKSQNTLLDDLQDNYGLTAKEARKLADEMEGVERGLEGLDQSPEGLDELADKADSAAEAFARLKIQVEGTFGAIEVRGARANQILSATKSCLEALAGVEL